MKIYAHFFRTYEPIPFNIYPDIVKTLYAIKQ